MCLTLRLTKRLIILLTNLLTNLLKAFTEEFTFRVPPLCPPGLSDFRVNGQVVKIQNTSASLLAADPLQNLVTWRFPKKGLRFLEMSEIA